MAEVVLEWGKSKVIIYSIAKTKIVLFFKLYYQYLNNQIVIINLEILSKKIKFYKKVT